MGTSASSKGAPSGIPFVPPWVPDISPAGGQEAADDAEDQSTPEPQPSPAAPSPPMSPAFPEVPPATSPQPILIAPRGRFGPARISVGKYARSGSSDEMRRGLGHYVRKGYGGRTTAARRFGGTAITAGSLYRALSSAASGQAAIPGSPFDPALLAGRTAGEIMDAVVEAVRPIDGTQDAEASRPAIREALTALLNRFPEADLLDLSEEQRIFAIEQYVALDVYNRFNLDVGLVIQSKAPSISAALMRLKDIKDYIKQAVSAAFRQMLVVGQTLNARRITVTVSHALGETFQVFEDYLQ